MSKFHGTWRLASGSIRDVSNRAPLVVKDGRLHYTHSGMVAAQCVLSPDSAAPALRAALGEYIAYLGTYTVDEATGTVAHRIAGSNVKSYVGKVLERGYLFSGDRLRLLARLADQAELDESVRAEMRTAPG